MAHAKVGHDKYGIKNKSLVIRVVHIQQRLINLYDDFISVIHVVHNEVLHIIIN